MVAAEDHVVVADRGLQEVVAADCGSIVPNLHSNLRAAETLFVWVASEVSLAEELPAQIAAELEDG